MLKNTPTKNPFLEFAQIFMLLDLLEYVASLMKHLLEISKQLIQLLAAACHKVAKPGEYLNN